MTAPGGNRRLADQLARQAGGDMAERKILLVCSVALATTKTIPAARKVLAGWDGPASIRDGAVKLLDQLEGR